MVDFSITNTEKEIMKLMGQQRKNAISIARFWDDNEQFVGDDSKAPEPPPPNPEISKKLQELNAKRASEPGASSPGMFMSFSRMSMPLGAMVLPRRTGTPQPGQRGAGLGNSTLAAAGNDEQKKKWGHLNLAMANTEPGCGSDSKAIETTALLDGDEWVLNGEKIFVTGGIRCDAVVVWATLNKEAGRGAIKSFMVIKGTPGLELAKKEKKLGIRNSDTAAFVLKDCRIPRENLLGLDEEIRTGGGGFKGLMQTFNMTRPGVASGGIAHAHASLDFITEEMKKEGIEVDWEVDSPRRNAIQEKLVELEADIDAARLTVIRASWLAQQGKPNNLEAALCKAKGGGVARFSMQLALEMLGGIGITHDCLVEKEFRDARITDIYEGTGEINRLVVARAILNYSSEDLM